MRVVVVPPGPGRAAAWAPRARLASLVLIAVALGALCAGGLGVPLALATRLTPTAVALALAALLPPLLFATAILAAAAYLLLLGDAEGAGPVARHAAALAALAAVACRALALPRVLTARLGLFAPAHAAAVALFGLALAALAVGLVALTARPERVVLGPTLS